MLVSLQAMIFSKSKKLHSAPNPTWVEVNGAFSMDSGPDPFSHPNIKEKSSLATRDRVSVDYTYLAVNISSFSIVDFQFSRSILRLFQW